MPLLGGKKKAAVKKGGAMVGGKKKKVSAWNKFVKAHYHEMKIKHPNMSSGEIFAKLAVAYRK